MHKKDSSSFEKHQFKPIGQFHKEKLRDKLLRLRDTITRRWPMNASSFNHSAKDSSY